MSTSNIAEINKKKLDKLKYEVLRLEDENSKTKDMTNSQMVDKLKQLIKDSVDGKLV